MASWPVREKRVPRAIVDLLGKATQRVVRQEILQAHSAEPAVRCLAAEKPPAQVMLRRALFALAA